ncbi:hypothetical protein DFH11DRAFT_1605714 [Phellopilus nigrolimitatus]|nr:hypothetical protein DFH11DRAFT_1605714 [Phellopilus nigrolimitatus]
MASYVDILILGAGWTSDFLIPLLRNNNITFAATTRDGRTRSGYATILLPNAQTVIVTFPIYKSGASEGLVKFWKETHAESKAAFVQLGSTGIWNGDPTAQGTQPIWCDRHSPFDNANDRARAEIEFLNLSEKTPTTVLNLSGLWGGQRDPHNWIQRVAGSKEELAKKGNIHLIHGIDVARAILAVHQNFEASKGQRWLLTDCRVYDWWDLASAWGEPDARAQSEKTEQDDIRTPGTLVLSTPAVLGPQPGWVRELMAETGVHALPRGPGALERVLDSREFWDTFGISPAKTLLIP